MSEGEEGPPNIPEFDFEAIKRAAEARKAEKQPNAKFEEDSYKLALDALGSLRPLLESKAIENQLELPPEAIASTQRMIEDIYESVDSWGDIIVGEAFRERSGNYETVNFLLRPEESRETEKIGCYILRRQGKVVAVNLAFYDRRLAHPEDLLKAFGQRTSAHGLHFQGGMTLQVCMINGEQDAVLEDNDLLIRALAATPGVEPAGLKTKITDKLPGKVIDMLMSGRVSIKVGAIGSWKDSATKIEYILEAEPEPPELWRRFPDIESPDNEPAVYFGRINNPPDSKFREPERSPAPEPDKVKRLNQVPVGVTT